MDKIDKSATGELKTGGKIKVNGKEYTAVVKGDTNGDGKTNSQDALEILKHSAGLKNLMGYYLKAADINNDEKINSSVALKVLKYSAGLDKINLSN